MVLHSRTHIESETKEQKTSIKDVMQHIDRLSCQRQRLVDQEKLVDRNIARLKLPLASIKKSYHQKYELEDLESEHRNIRKETDRVDKLICQEFESGARAMRFTMRCIGPCSKTVTGDAKPPKPQRDEPANLEAA